MASPAAPRRRNAIIIAATTIVAVASLTVGIAIIILATGGFALGAANAGYTKTAHVPRLTQPLHLTRVSRPQPSNFTAYALQLKSRVASRAIRYRTVSPGDTLSILSQRAYGRPDCWPGIYRQNRGLIGANPNVIEAGRRFVIPAGCDTRPVKMPAVSPPVVTVSHTRTQSTSNISADSGYNTSNAFQACVIRAESGGNAQIFNSTGHYGLYQFSPETWDAAGGDPNLFGNASAAYQTQVFWMAYRLWGTSPWAPYDGC